ncbi:MAG: hypothetical protein Q9224_006667, partial [Gallowayella concinna]
MHNHGSAPIPGYHWAMDLDPQSPTMLERIWFVQPPMIHGVAARAKPRLRASNPRANAVYQSSPHVNVDRLDSAYGAPIIRAYRSLDVAASLNQPTRQYHERGAKDGVRHWSVNSSTYPGYTEILLT